MSILQSLFNETKDNGVAKKHLKRISRSCRELKGFESLIPDMKYPMQGTDSFNEDIDEVRRCIKHPNLNKSFLKISDGSVESIYEKYLIDNNLKFNWDLAERLVKDLDTVILRLKYKHQRPRPKEFFIVNGEALSAVDASSPSFPSGHTAIAYLLSSTISNAFPEHRMSLQTLAEMIAQSRLENGAHFPTDITAGRFLGEAAYDYYLEKLNQHKSKDNNQQNLLHSLKKASLETRKEINEKRAIQLYNEDFSEFLGSVSGASESDCISCSTSFLNGFPSHLCTEDLRLKLALDFLSESASIADSDYLGYMSLNKILQQEDLTQLREEDEQNSTGIACPQISKILDMTKKCFGMEDRPYMKFLLLNYIKPFKTKNKKFAKLILAKDLGYNFDIVNQLIDKGIDLQVENLCKDYDIETMLMI